MVEIAEEKGFFLCPKCETKTTLSRRNLRLGQRCSNCGTMMERKFEEVEPTTLVVEESKVIEVEVKEETEVRAEEAQERVEAVPEVQKETVEEVPVDRLEDSQEDRGTEDKAEETEAVKEIEKMVPVQEPSTLVEDIEVPKTIAELERVVEKDAKAVEVDIEAEAKKLVEETKMKASINTVGASDVKEIEKAIEEMKEESG